MSYQSDWKINIPEVDVLSYIFDEAVPQHDFPLFENAEDARERITKAELKDLATRAGKGLREVHAVGEGDVVLMCCHNTIKYPVVYLATLCAGGVFCGSNPNVKTLELLTHLNIASPKVIFTDLMTLPTVERALETYKGPEVTIYILEDGTQYGWHTRYQHLSHLMSNGNMQWERVTGKDVLSKRIAMLAFSSGTTGPPKACAYSHYNLVAATEQKCHIETIRFPSENKATYPLHHRYCVYLPLFHIAGFMWHIHMNCRTGAPTYILTSYSLQRMVRAVQRHQITDLLMVPAIIPTLAKCGLDLKDAFSSLRVASLGAAYFGRESLLALRNVLQRDNVLIQQGWGMTETTAATTLFHHDQTDGTTVGHLLANLEAKLVDENGNIVPPGTPGEAVIRGPSIFAGYWKNPAATNEVKSGDGWLRTGDLVTVDGQGLFAVVGRTKELIKVKGFQVSPSEVETVLLSSGAVRDCAVIGVQRGGRECPQAHIVPVNTSVTVAEISSFVQSRLSDYKQLTGGIYLVESIPRNPSGKVLRRLIKDPELPQSRI